MSIDRAYISSLVRDIPDFPSPGILFKDITPAVGDARGFSEAVLGLMEIAGEFDLVAGVEARGFIFGAAIASISGKGFIPIRKSGKLPYRSYSESYSLEYGSSTLEIHEDAIAAGVRVLLVDDVLATGGTLIAATKLIERCGGVVTATCVLMEIDGLAGRVNYEQAFSGKPISVLI
jgi:adenine phosphoribosyltransferase